jgi:serine/threonine protein kinase
MAFQDPWYVYLVMECAIGGDTYSLIKENSPKLQDFKNLGETAIRFIAGCVILGLEFLHKSNYMYIDLKPENVLIF